MANPISESLNEAPIIQKVIIIIAIIAVPLYFFANYRYLPNNTTLNQLKRDVVKLQIISNRLPLVKKSLAQYTRQFKILSKNLPNKKEIPNLIKKIVSLAQKNGIIVNRFNPSLLVNKKKFYNTVNINLDLISSYTSLGRFITDLSDEKRIIIPGKILITGATTKSENLATAHIALRLSTYYFKNSRKK